jgi:hypothetical protein
MDKRFMDKKFEVKHSTLTDADISSQRHVSRRSLLSALGLGLGVAAAAAVGRSPMSAAQAPSRCSDNDGGRFADPPGFGRRCRQRPVRPTGCTDMDSGFNEDPPGYGRRCSNWI